MEVVKIQQCRKLRDRIVNMVGLAHVQAFEKLIRACATPETKRCANRIFGVIT
jgi:hypothetical protein